MSYLSTKYSKIARVSLEFNQPSADSDRYGKHLPNGEVIVLVVDDGGDATIGIDLQVVWGLVLPFSEIEVDRLVRQPEFFKNNGDFPDRGRVGFQIPKMLGGGGKRTSR